MARTRRLVAAAAVLALAAPASAAAAPIAVDTTDDGVNPAGCSLREAIESANSHTAVG